MISEDNIASVHIEKKWVVSYMDTPVGRPLKYPDEDQLVIKAQEYLDQCGREQTSLPTIEGLSIYLDLDDDNVNEYRKRYPKFHATIKKLKHMQKRQLIDDGMYGGKEVNSTMAIFLLKVNHGMIETEKKILAGNDGQPLSINLISGGYGIPDVGDNASSPKKVNKGSAPIQDGDLASSGKKNDDSDLRVDPSGTI